MVEPLTKIEATAFSQERTENAIDSLVQAINVKLQEEWTPGGSVELLEGAADSEFGRILKTCRLRAGRTAVQQVAQQFRDVGWTVTIANDNVTFS